MIARLKGTLISRSDPFIILDVHDVGYKVYCSHTVLSRISHLGESLTLFAYTHVREDILELYGFAEAEDLKLFEYLLSVSGIGPKTAIGVFAVGTRQAIVQAITTGDTAFFTAVPRLGKKNAQKLIIELKNKLGGTLDFDVTADERIENDDVVSALRNFGFSTQEAITAVRKIEKGEQTTSEKIRLALKELGK